MDGTLEDMEAQMLSTWKSMTMERKGSRESGRPGLQCQPPAHRQAALGSDRLGFAIQRNGAVRSDHFQRSLPLSPDNHRTRSHILLVPILLHLLKMGRIAHRYFHQMQASNVSFVQFGKQYSPLQNRTLLTIHQISLQKYKENMHGMHLTPAIV